MATLEVVGLEGLRSYAMYEAYGLIMGMKVVRHLGALLMTPFGLGR